MATDSREIESVAVALADLKERCFLVGGASIPFYLTDKLEEHPRVTLDIDVVVEVRSVQEYRSTVETQMRAHGFVNDMTEGAPICRWKLGLITVDLMPANASILGFSNKWYEAGSDNLIPVQVTKSCRPSSAADCAGTYEASFRTYPVISPSKRVEQGRPGTRKDGTE